MHTRPTSYWLRQRTTPHDMDMTLWRALRPVQAVYVSAGALGKQALEGGVKVPKSVLALGAAATVAAIVLVGHVAQKTLMGMELDKAASSSKKP